MTASSKRSLDEYELQLVEHSKALEGLSHRELTALARQLRSRRERVLRAIRGRNRAARKAGGSNPDTGAREKKELLIEAIGRVNAALDASSYDNPASGTSVAKPKAAPKKPSAKKAATSKTAAPKATAKKTDGEKMDEKPKKKPVTPKAATGKSATE